MIVQISRIKEGGRQTLGELTVIENGKVLFRCNTLELPNLHNKRNVSSIPTGEYKAFKRYTRKQWLLQLKDVPNRSGIQIHKGNFYTQIEGCVLVGRTFTDLNKDGYYDVTDSTDTLHELMSIVPDDIDVVVKKKLA